MLRKVSFIVAVLGIAVLMVLLSLPAKELDYGSAISLENIGVNEKISVQGRVDSERDFGDFKVWKMVEGDFRMVCDCKESYLNQEVDVVGVVEEYEGEKQVRVLRIR